MFRQLQVPTYTHAHTYACRYIQTHTHIDMHADTCTCTHVDASEHMQTHADVHVEHKHMHTEHMHTPDADENMHVPISSCLCSPSSPCDEGKEVALATGPVTCRDLGV